MVVVAPFAGITPQVRRVSAGAKLGAGRYLSRLSRQHPWFSGPDGSYRGCDHGPDTSCPRGHNVHLDALWRFAWTFGLAGDQKVHITRGEGKRCTLWTGVRTVGPPLGRGGSPLSRPAVSSAP